MLSSSRVAGCATPFSGRFEMDERRDSTPLESDSIRDVQETLSTIIRVRTKRERVVRQAVTMRRQDVTGKETQ